MGLNWFNGFFEYHSDDGNTYTVGLRNEKAASGNFAESDTKFGTLPRGYHMRGVWAQNDDGAKMFFPIASNQDSRMTWGFFPILFEGNPWHITARIGEKRKSKP